MKKKIIGLLIISTLCGCFDGKDYKITKNSKRESLIYSLRNTEKIHGSFVLAIGTIGSTEYYVFYRKTPSGGLIREQLDVADCILYEDSAVPRCIEYGELEERFQDGKLTHSYFNNDSPNTNVLHQIHIPKGTITERFSIELN